MLRITFVGRLNSADALSKKLARCFSENCDTSTLCGVKVWVDESDMTEIIGTSQKSIFLNRYNSFECI